MGWVADTIATNALRFFSESLQKLKNFSGFRSCPQNFPGHGFLGPWQFCCSLSRGGFRGWVGGADAFFLRDSILLTEIQFIDGTFKISKGTFGANKLKTPKKRSLLVKFSKKCLKTPILACFFSQNFAFAFGVQNLPKKPHGPRFALGELDLPNWST